MAIAKGFAKELSIAIVALLSIAGTSVAASHFKADSSEIEIPVCRALPSNSGQGELDVGGGSEVQAAPWSETRPDVVQLELLNCLARQEAAYRERGDQARAAAARSRMQAVRQAVCRDFDQQKITCPVSSRMTRPQTGECRIDGPSRLLPEAVTRIRIGMTKAELESILGAADYSPAEGLYYFSTGGDCLVGETDHQASCGVVAEFRETHADGARETGVSDKLQSCWWGGIAE